MYAARGEPFLGMVEQVLTYAPWLDGALALGDAYALRLVSFNVMFSFGYEAGLGNMYPRSTSFRACDKSQMRRA